MAEMRLTKVEPQSCLRTSLWIAHGFGKWRIDSWLCRVRVPKFFNWNPSITVESVKTST